MKKVYQAVSEMVLPAIVFSAVVSILVGAALFARRFFPDGRCTDSASVM